MLKNYIKIALKVLLRRKFFTFISLFGISFTLLILVVTTSIVDFTFGPHMPEKKLDRMLSSQFFNLSGKRHAMGAIFSYYGMNKYVKPMKTPEKVTIFSLYNSIVTYKENKKFEFRIKFTDSEFWEILDFEFIEGKPYNHQDVENGSLVAVINEDTRKQYFGGKNAVGQYIEADGLNYRVTGVVKNVSILRFLPHSDIWVPVTTSKLDLNKPTLMSAGSAGFGAFILARDKSDFPKIKEELKRNLSMVEFPDDNFNSIKGSADTYLETISRVMFRDYDNAHTGNTLTIIFLLMILFMLLPTINLININISRIMERASEIGIRKSFGASSMTLVGQFIVENIIITIIGGIISLILSVIVLSIINSSGFIPHVQLGLNLRIFFISFCIILFFGLFSGVYPAFKMSRFKPVDALRGGQV